MAMAQMLLTGNNLPNVGAVARQKYEKPLHFLPHLIFFICSGGGQIEALPKELIPLARSRLPSPATPGGLSLFLRGGKPEGLNKTKLRPQ
jgi:hypothetical protein